HRARALEPRRRPQARLRDHPGRARHGRGRPRARHALWRAGAARAAGADRSAPRRGPPPPLPAHRERSDRAQGATSSTRAGGPDGASPLAGSDGVIKALCFATLRLYPDAWRQRYELEMRAVIEQSEPSLATMLDLMGGA